MKVVRFASPLLLLFLVVHLHAQNRMNDSLWSVFNNTAQTDTARIKAIHQLAFRFAYSDPDSAMQLANAELSFSKKMNSPRFEAGALATIGTCYLNKGDFKKSYDFTMQSYDIRRKINDRKGIAVSLNNIGILFYQQGDYPRAIDYYQQSLRIKEEIGDMAGVAAAYSNIGMVYADDEQTQKALEFYLSSLRIRDSIDDRRGIADSYSKLVQTYLHVENYDLAKTYLDKFIAICDTSGNKKGLGSGLNDMGEIMEARGQIDSAEFYYKRSLEIRRSIKDMTGICYSLVALGTVENNKDHFKEAENYCAEGLSIAEQAGFPEGARQACNCLTKSYEGQGDTRNALKFYKKSIALRDSLLNEEKSRDITRKTMRYEFDKKQLSDSLRRAEEDHVREMRESEKDQRMKLYIFAGIGGFVLMMMLALVLWNSNQQGKRANALLSEKNKIIEEKNKDITDSINYAQKIQVAIFPEWEIKNRLFPESFVMLLPRDVVSGDFYWFGEQNRKRIIAAVDCTGHGVPGAFMSMIGNAFLNEIIHERKITQPSVILNELREMVIRSLKQNENEMSFTQMSRDNASVKDGMDISLCVFDEDFSKVEFAGANNPMWIVRNGAEVLEIAADKQPIGLSGKALVPFTSHEVALQKGDRVYIFSDGYADQFGGVDGKKFKYRQLKELLLSIHNKPMREQEEILLRTFFAWKGNLEQVDDVCVIGVAI